ncbi:MAG: hypothetical protein IJ493_13635 [Clostridia bacterium]|nr:hypothetical protein [Clostridia bacterium]
MNIINELYYGNINPSADPPALDGEGKHLRKKMMESCERFRDTLSEEQKKKYDAYETLLTNYHAVCEELIFIRAFRLGALMMLDILRGEDE